MYIFDIHQLQPFDIVLVRFPDNRFSNIIRRFCNSEFSHAIVYLGNSSFIEAEDPIVTLFSAQRYFFNSLNNIKVLRLNSTEKSTFDVEKAETCLRGLSYCNYSNDLLGYMKSHNISEEIITTFNDTWKWTDGVICSSLVTLPYAAGGIDISTSLEPYYSHFGDIERYPGFEDVTNLVFTTSNEQNSDDTFDYFSLVQTGSILEKQSNSVKLLNELVCSIFSDLKANRAEDVDIRIEADDLRFSDWEDVYPYIMRWFNTRKGKEIDDKVYGKIVETEYNNLWFEEVHNKRRLFFPLYSIMTDKTSYALRNESVEHFEMTKNALEVYLIRISKNEDATSHNFLLCPCKTFHVQVDMYRSFSELIRTSILQYEAIIEQKQMGLL